MVEIQPYEFKKKTNIEEHNDIVSKVNEIVDVINDTQMDTINTRLTAVEGDVTALESEVSGLDNELATKADKSEIPDTSTFATKTEVDAVDTKVGAIDSQLESMQTEIDGKLSSVPIGGDNIGGVKNGGNVTINADGTMNASGTGTGITQNVLTYAGNKLKSTVNGVESNEVEIVAGGGGVSSVVVTNPAPGNITVNVDGKSGNADIDTLASGIEVYGSEFPPDSGNASAYIKLNDTISAGEIGKYTEGGTSFIRIGNEDTRLLADTVELRNEAPDEGCKLTSGANGELLVNGVAMKNYTLPVGGTALGGVKNGGNVTIDAQGNMNAPTTPAYTLPVASANTLGGVKIGSGVSVGADGTISVSADGGQWEEIGNGSFPTDFQLYDTIMLVLSETASDNNNTSNWDTQPSAPIFTDSLDVITCLFTIIASEQTCATPIQIKNTFFSITIMEIFEIAGLNDWNNPESSTTLIKLGAITFNGGGLASQTMNINRQELTSSSRIRKIYRFRP